MKIAQVSPLYESVPPSGYGGTERVVAYLTDELVRQGHDVTLFASGDSVTTAGLVPICPRALRLDSGSIDALAHHILTIERVRTMHQHFDVIHFHIDYVHFPVSRRAPYAHVTTLHGRLDIPDLQPLYQEFSEMPIVSISQAQRAPLPGANWQGTVQHGLPRHLFSLNDNPSDYLAFVGRISPEKRLDRAIAIAGDLGMRLRVAAKIDKADRLYFEREIAGLISAPHVEFIGEVGDSEKAELLGGARALLFPIDWCEPFGLVMIEAMACGTPVIAWRCGAVDEIITDDINGFVVESMDEAVAATRRAMGMDRRRCREAFERRFTAERMASDYVRIYQALVNPSRAPRAMPDGEVA